MQKMGFMQSTLTETQTTSTTPRFGQNPMNETETTPALRQISIRDALNEALAEELTRDPNVFLMGEEVAEYDGAYKVSRGLFEKFGPKRVIDTPIAENGFAGLGVGAAMMGLRPVIEFMTWNFSLIAIDQIINHAATARYMSGGEIKCPIVFRGPNGSVQQLGAQHSHSMESYYAHCPGLKVIMPSNAYDAKGLLKTAIRDEDPVIFLESEAMYSVKGGVPEGEYTIPFGVADIKRAGKDVTLIAWSKTVQTSLDAAEILAAEGVSVEVIDIRSLRPLDEAALITSIKKTNRCVIVQEAWPIASYGTWLASHLTELAFDHLDAPIFTISGLDLQYPYAKNLEAILKPSAQKVVEKIRRVL
jgi:pyruvate dehydrogenase E1 component beta subunit